MGYAHLWKKSDTWPGQWLSNFDPIKLSRELADEKYNIGGV